MARRKTRVDIKSRCEGLAALISGVQKAYWSANAEERLFIETAIGAAVWYLPNTWGGYISLKAVEMFRNEPAGKRVMPSEEHIYPRKLSACELLNMMSVDADEVQRRCMEKYSKIMYITRDENKASAKFQKQGVFKSPMDVCNQAGIRLVPITEDEFCLLKKRDVGIIDDLLSRKPITSL